jgi:hypothetical protein
LRGPLQLSNFIKIIAAVSSRFYVAAPRLTHSVTLSLTISDSSGKYRELVTDGLVKPVLCEVKNNGHLCDRK